MGPAAYAPKPVLILYRSELDFSVRQGAVKAMMRAWRWQCNINFVVLPIGVYTDATEQR